MRRYKQASCPRHKMLVSNFYFPNMTFPCPLYIFPVCRFPDNIVEIGTSGSDDNRPCCVERIFKDKNGVLKVQAREFKKVVPSFTSPYTSKRIGNFVCSDVSSKSTEYNFSDIVGKFFPFPTELPLTSQHDKPNPLEPNQEWVFQRINHSEIG